MDAVSYSHADKQKQRIEKVIANPDSTSGIVTVPSTIAVGETVTIPTGRTAVLPNLVVEGTLVVEGEMFVPAGSGYTATDIESTNAVFGTLQVQGENVSPFSGFKNYIINGKKVINQSGLTSTDNSYNQDQWYKVGNNWYQPIEGDNNLINGKTYTLSWEGVATASYYVGSESSATISGVGTFTAIANGGSLTLTIAAGQHLWIKFASDATGSTFNFVQVEEGTVVTPFEHRPYGLELSLCQRYYIKINGVRFQGYAGGVAAETSQTLTLPSPMRIAPSWTGITSGNFANVSGNILYMTNWTNVSGSIRLESIAAGIISVTDAGLTAKAQI